MVISSCSKEEVKLNPAPNNPDVIVTLTSEALGKTIPNNDPVLIKADVSSPVGKVEFYVDGLSVASDITPPYEIDWTPVDLSPGKHVISAVATTSENKSSKAEGEFNVILRLGDTFKGGKIFYLDATGKTGLVASIEDLNYGSQNSFAWAESGAHLGTDTSNGEENTKKMAASAKNAREAGYHFKPYYEKRGFKDWYIPSLRELEVLKENMNYVGGFPSKSADAFYWSSSESTATVAHVLNFIALAGNYQTKSNFHYKIRPIRKF
jgi:hypothetical protein